MYCAQTGTMPGTASDYRRPPRTVGRAAQASGGPGVSLREMQSLAKSINDAPEHDPSRFGLMEGGRLLVPGVASSFAQCAQIYLMNISQFTAPSLE